jgi:tetratricopeptide (TPR) repeat protein
MKYISIIALFLVAAICTSTTHAQSTAEEFFKQSFERLKDRDVVGALDALDKSIKLKPDFARAYVQRAKLIMLKGNLDGALDDLNKALLIDPELSYVYAERGRVRMMKNDVKGALGDFDNAIGRGYRSDEIYSGRAHLKMMLQDFDGAIRDFDAAVSMNQERISHAVGRADARSMAGNDDGAMADYTSVIEKFEQDELDRIKAGKPSRVAPAMDLMSPIIKGTESASAKEKGQTTRMDAVVTMRSNPSRPMTPEQMEYLPNVSGAYMNRGLLYSKRGDAAAALADLNKAIEINPSDFAAYYSRGKERQKRGKLDEALNDFNKSIQLRPLASAHLERGVTLVLLGRDGEAEGDFDEALKMEPRMRAAVETRRAAAKKETNQKSP